MEDKAQRKAPSWPEPEGSAPSLPYTTQGAKRSLGRTTVVIGVAIVLAVIVAAAAIATVTRYSPTPAPASQPQQDQSDLLTLLSASKPNDNNIAITIQYRATAEPVFSIGDVRMTTGRTTIQHYQPFSNNPFVTIRVLDASGSVAAEEKIGTSTTLTAEDFDLEDPSQQNPLLPLVDASTYVVIPLPQDTLAAHVQLLDESGHLIEEQSVPQQASSSAPNTQDKSAFRAITTYLRQFVRAVPTLAQTPTIPPSQPNKFTIVLINEVDFSLPDGPKSTDAHTMKIKGDNVRAMLIPLEPWNTLRDSIEVIVIDSNKTPLGCTVANLLPNPDDPANPFGFPQCPNDQQVIQAVEAKGVSNWNVIAVITPFPCNCGSVAAPGLPPIVAMGEFSTSAAFAHEFGHAVGKMGDEFLYRFNNTQSDDHPNCFKSLDDCRAAIGNFPRFDAECRPGCQSILEWRPATRIMHNSYQPYRYGPHERCLLGQKISGGSGITPYNCNP
jgi:hypothetical protein